MNVHYKNKNKLNNNNILTPWETQNDPFEYENDIIAKFSEKRIVKSHLENENILPKLIKARPLSNCLTEIAPTRQRTLKSVH
jgi:hypothetical protein